MNVFRYAHPAVAVVYYAIAVALPVVRSDVATSAVVLSGILLQMAVISKSVRAAAAWTATFLPFAALFVAAAMLFNRRGGHVMFQIGGWQPTYESALAGLAAALTIGAAFAAFETAGRVVPAETWLSVASGRAPNVALLLAMTVRFVPHFRRRLGEIALARRALGEAVAIAPNAIGGKTAAVRNTARLLGLLLPVALEETARTADAMTARGYGTGPRTRYRRFRFRRGDAFRTTVFAAAALPAFGVFVGENPVMSAVAAAVYALLPMVFVSPGFSGRLRFLRSRLPRGSRDARRSGFPPETSDAGRAWGKKQWR
ncbi:MAG: hypothetical protein BLM47_05715 [Candidatus Reconcilbacillus cellulovorans]|uniref:Cobalt transporter n=1 Tax=Candidatus Reconcilbacillus cellulovorans TaxID=1906605 RepID=A0A2A6E112_9BACL|nr:MAG: hypothetical protein BLM47_05715 [Candidatus Reconcilbacillus cellulovorans]